MEQSLPPYNRYLSDLAPSSYEEEEEEEKEKEKEEMIDMCPEKLRPLSYTPVYEETVREVMGRLRGAQRKEEEEEEEGGGGGLLLAPLPPLSPAVFEAVNESYALYRYMKEKVENGEEWVEEGEEGCGGGGGGYVDGLQRFLGKGFAAGEDGCWRKKRRRRRKEEEE